MPDKPIDWSQLWYPGPRRQFTAAEMARAGADGPSPTLLAVAACNAALIAFVTLQLAPAAHTARLSALLIAVVVLGYFAARYLWRRPWRGPLMLVSLAAVLLMLFLALGVRWRVPDRDERRGAALLMLTLSIALPILLWFLVVWRSHQIESRLRELDERERAIEMARRLAAAQIEPHFLFNTLASAQHWVQSKDDRAGPLLAALTGYLRATLPLFKHESLPASDELLAVQRFLEVMQLRMGKRLGWQIEVEPALQRALLPPGLLLTLVENAIVHGVEPKLDGGRLLLRGHLAGAQACFEVIDNGAGFVPGTPDGLGLANIRQRLALLRGMASLQLTPVAGGGCRAELSLPFEASPT